MRGNKGAKIPGADKRDNGIPEWAVDDLCEIPKYALSDEQGERFSILKGFMM